MCKKEKINIIEVGPRDGLQNVEKFIPTEIKCKFINQLVSSGIKELEVTSFVSPKAIPQLSDAEKLMSLLENKEGVTYSCLVPTMKGLERAISSGVKKIVFFVAASNEFNKKNLNAGIKETIANFKEMKKICDKNNITVKGSISTSFYCPYSGYVKPTNVLNVMNMLSDMGISEITLCDTVGTATPKDVEILLSTILKYYKSLFLGLHMHNTYGFALACIYKAFEMGIRKFESSAGGIGGCPNAPGATGNIATEILVNFFHKMGIETGISLEGLENAFRVIEGFIEKDKKCIRNM